MENMVQVLLLGLVQGVTEFLPVSSSGHLVVLTHLLSSQDLARMGTALEVALHVGTLLAVLAYYRGDLLRILRSIPGRALPQEERSRGRVLLLGIAVGTAATALVVFPFKRIFEACFERPVLVGGALCVTGLLCLSTRFVPRGHRPIRRMGLVRFLAVGFAQGIAVIPGISRSGATIVTAMVGGVEPVAAARFSFLLSIPAVAGAAVMELRRAGDGALPFPVMAVGVAVSALVGFACLGLLTRVIRAGRFYGFGYYCLALGALVMIGFGAGRF